MNLFPLRCVLLAYTSTLVYGTILFKLLVSNIQDLGEKRADELAAAEHVNIIDYINYAIAKKLQGAVQGGGSGPGV